MDITDNNAQQKLQAELNQTHTKQHWRIKTNPIVHKVK